MEKLIENNFKRQEFKFILDKKSFLSLVKEKNWKKFILPEKLIQYTLIL